MTFARPIDSLKAMKVFALHLRTRTNLQVAGLVDVQLQNGQWVGYSAGAGGIVVK